MFFRISVFRNRPSRLVASCTNLFCCQYTHVVFSICKQLVYFLFENHIFFVYISTIIVFLQPIFGGECCAVFIEVRFFPMP